MDNIEQEAQDVWNKLRQAELHKLGKTEIDELPMSKRHQLHENVKVAFAKYFEATSAYEIVDWLKKAKAEGHGLWADRIRLHLEFMGINRPIVHEQEENQ